MTTVAFDSQLEKLDLETRSNVTAWLTGPYDEKSKETIRNWLKGDSMQIVDAFYRTLEFGTAGLRGIMGVGSNRLNLYTVRAATQGLANYLKKQEEVPGPHSVLIGYDSRNNSRLFAEETAKVLAANEIQTYLYAHLRPVPLVSFGCRFKGCTAAIMITASHNPKEYNGYKVYWKDGAQVLPPHDVGIIKEVERVKTPSDVKETKEITLEHPLIQLIEEEIDKVYLERISELQNYPEQNRQSGSSLKIIYTPLYGAGITIVPKAMEAWGFAQPLLVEEQSTPNGDFPTTPYPNPEERAALQLGISKLEKEEADLLLATDPDADRLGVVVRHEGQSIPLTGNEIACVCVKHICKALKERGLLPQRAAFIKTIVTSELFARIVKSYGKPCFNVLPGFKYIGQMIGQWEKDPNGYQYIYGGEESYGTMFGTNTRDKDAEISSVLVAEAALQMKLQGKTLVDLLWEIYEEHGLFREKLISLVREGKTGHEEIQAMMTKLREGDPKEFCAVPVITVDDYKSGLKRNLKTGEQWKLTLPPSNVLVYWLEDSSRLIIRPSGTEPKIKLYGEVFGSGVTRGALKEQIASEDARLDLLLAALKGRLVSN